VTRQIILTSHNAFVAAAPPRTPLGGAYSAPQTYLGRFGEGNREEGIARAREGKETE